MHWKAADEHLLRYGSLALIFIIDPALLTASFFYRAVIVAYLGDGIQSWGGRFCFEGGSLGLRAVGSGAL